MFNLSTASLSWFVSFNFHFTLHINGYNNYLDVAPDIHVTCDNTSLLKKRFKLGDGFRAFEIVFKC